MLGARPSQWGFPALDLGGASGHQPFMGSILGSCLATPRLLSDTSFRPGLGANSGGEVMPHSHCSGAVQCHLPVLMGHAGSAGLWAAEEVPTGCLGWAASGGEDRGTDSGDIRERLKGSPLGLEGAGPGGWGVWRQEAKREVRGPSQWKASGDTSNPDLFSPVSQGLDGQREP